MCRRLWKCTGGRSWAARNPGNHVVTVLGSMGAPFHLVNSKSFSTIFPAISTRRTHAVPILSRSARWCWRYSRSSCTHSGPILMHRRERFVLGVVNTVPLPGMYCTFRSMDSVPASKSTSHQRSPQISLRRAPVNKASCVITLNCADIL